MRKGETRPRLAVPDVEEERGMRPRWAMPIPEFEQARRTRGRVENRFGDRGRVGSFAVVMGEGGNAAA